MSNVKDMTKGIYRRIYTSALTDKRVNALSMEAELTLSRLKLLADDHGNLQGEPGLVLILAYPRRREITQEQIDGWLQELREAGFISDYEAEEDQYLHIVDWFSEQPAGKNGKRVRRFPPSPAEDRTPENPRESEIIPENAGESTAYQDQTMSMTNLQDQNQGQSRVQESLTQSNGNGLGSALAHGRGVGGLAGGNADRYMAVSDLLKKIGINSEMLHEVAKRSDITVDRVRTEWSKVQNDPDIESPTGVLLHRLRVKPRTRKRA